MECNEMKQITEKTALFQLKGNKNTLQQPKDGIFVKIDIVDLILRLILNRNN